MTEQRSAKNLTGTVTIEVDGMSYAIVGLESLIPYLQRMEDDSPDESLAILGLDYLAEVGTSAHNGIRWGQIRDLYEMMQALKSVTILSQAR